jgi:predicted ribosomally synthesized peptide with nif11-like leader
MANEAIAEFLEVLDERPEVRAELLSALEEREDQAPVIVEIAAKHGFEFTEDDYNGMMEAVAATRGRSLSDEELESVAGGSGRTGPPPPAGIKEYQNFRMNFAGRRAVLFFR